MIAGLVLAFGLSAAGGETPSQAALDVLARRCQGCHHVGGSAPFSMSGAAGVRAWSAAMLRAVRRGDMPPWHATEGPGVFANDRRLAPEERRLLLEWLEAGAEAAEADWAVFEASSRDDGDEWTIGTPDLVLELPAVEVPADGDVPYHNYVLETGLEQDVWVSAAETLPGDPSVVHHIIVEALVQGPTRPGDDPRTVGSLGGYVPGDGPLVMPPGWARRLPRGARIVFQVHYTPSGTAAVDRSKLGLVFSEQPPQHEARTGIVSTPFLWIPAGASDVEVSATHVFDEDVVLTSMRPHMHLRGREFRFDAVLPSGERRRLLSVEDYDFGWQTTYVLAEPAELPKGTRLEAHAVYDNSAANPQNPDPGQDVSWGERTADEMMIGFFEYRSARAQRAE